MTANGTPSSSVRAYRFPTETAVVSSLVETPFALSSREMTLESSFMPASLSSGKIVHLMGAMTGENRNTVFCSSSFRT